MKLLIVLLSLLYLIPVLGQNNSPATFITNVTLVDVERQKLVTNVTVGFTGIMITAVTVKKPTIPGGAKVIDGTGKFLIPGLTDAHIHFSQTGGLYTRPDAIDLRKNMPYADEIKWSHENMEDVLKRYVRKGITSVIDVGSTLNFLQLREKFRDKNFAPAIYMTGPLITSYEPAEFKGLENDNPFYLVATPEEGRQMVQKELAYKPDFIKIWYILGQGQDKEAVAQKFLPTAKAIIDEAHKNKLKVAVHATERITAELAVEAGADYLVHSIDDEILSAAFIKKLQHKKVILCPTLTVFSGYSKAFGQNLDFSAEELRDADPYQVSTLFDMEHLPDTKKVKAYRSAIKNAATKFARQDSICMVNLKKLSDGGIRIAAGTDAGNIGTMHSSSFLRELKAMQKAGMNNWQILQSATINPSYILNQEKSSGSVAVGKKADLILLQANPVEELGNLDKIEMVINKGHVIRPDTLIKETPLALVQRQLNAYNTGNLEAFLEPYADDVELYDFPGQLYVKGKDEMRKRYGFLNTVPELHCEIVNRIIQGNVIIDQEKVTGFKNVVHATAIYEIENNKIKKVHFISPKK
jgi:imidazolonepropionase-like amidohydrolase